eukprot:3175391-Alexandrium_andersonii.AAC.1
MPRLRPRRARPRSAACAHRPWPRGPPAWQQRFGPGPSGQMPLHFALSYSSHLGWYWSAEKVGRPAMRPRVVMT